MKRVLYFILLVAVQASAKIEELKSYSDINLATITENTLVVFDIDNTLLRQDHQIGTHQWGDYMKARAIKNGMPAEQAAAFQHKAFAEIQPYAKVQIVEPKVSKLLKYLKNRNVKHFALTARSSHIMDTTIKQLGILKHDFASSFPSQKDTTLLNNYLREGVIFSGDTPKGELLKLIISNSNVRPDKIVFIDDKLYNLESVEKSFAEETIMLTSYRYSAADVFVKSFNPQIADLQYSFFLENHEVLPDNVIQNLNGDLQAIVALRFQKFIDDFGTNGAVGTNCSPVVVANPLRPIYYCDYFVDGDWAYQSFQFQKTADGSITFGNW
ncbi:MAG: DUF2608 domain-containing protein [Bdellovibrionota bacterium]